ncbi:hypothetical protein ACFY2M_24630 [Streptomyces sp. NPDC001276]|uniref:hypothetical protein n=1 Tax=Streptomyces sp. NPDC001276 TaxID=3364555 RepID=UPI00369192AE
MLTPPGTTPAAASDTGRRNRTLQLLRTDPARPWRPTEIAAALKIGHYRSFCAQLGQWARDGMLHRVGRGLYTLNPAWANA